MNTAVLGVLAQDARPAAAALPLSCQRPSTRDMMQRALDPFVLLGMPHLTPFGLSETWLMKELGHRHWMMLALRLGMHNADFRTADGREAYASICATSLQERHAGLPAARANDVLEIRSSLASLSRSQHSSHHSLAIGGRPICDVELVSAFVARGREGDNHSLVRVEQGRGHGQDYAVSQLARRGSVMRRMVLERAANVGGPGAQCPTFTVTPDPDEDFNGAGLLYFAGFQAIFSGALAALTAAPCRPRRREIFFFGNVRPGEPLAVHIDRNPDDDGPRCFLSRPDGKIIACYDGGSASSTDL